MTDYLEELLENTEALLDQVRRSERNGTVPAEESPPLSPTPTARRGGSGQSEENQDAPSEESASENREAFQPGGQDGSPEPPRRALTPLGEERDAPSSPLLDQLERLERAAESGSLSAGRRGRLGYPQALSKPGGGGLPPDLDAPSGWSGGGGLERPLPLPGGELRWAEQADRAFRRDSRRYDGGFYLY